MICNPCKKATDDLQFGVQAHAQYGCRSALEAIELNLAAGDIHGSTYCDCQHRTDIPEVKLSSAEMG